MLAFGAEPFFLDPSSTDGPAQAYRALADAARAYLVKLGQAAGAGVLPQHAALTTRVRGTGPGVSFGRVVAALESAPLQWVCPFEKSFNVSGAVLLGLEVTGEARHDAFLFLRFAPFTQDLPLHVHEDSDRFIFAVGGRGFFHVTTKSSVRHAAVRDRDVLMFGRGAVHTFSTAEHPLTLLSYHHPYVPLEDERQYLVPEPARTPADLLPRHAARVSFDSGWSVLADGAT